VELVAQPMENSHAPLAGWLTGTEGTKHGRFISSLPSRVPRTFSTLDIPFSSFHPLHTLANQSKKRSTEEEQPTMSPNDHTYDEIIAKIVSCSTDLTAVTKNLGPYLNNLNENIFLARAHGQSDPLDALSPENHSFAYLYFL